LTPKGRALYDRLLNEAGVGKDNLNHQRHLQEVFSEFPDSEFVADRRRGQKHGDALPPQASGDSETTPAPADAAEIRCQERKRIAMLLAPATIRNR
jgi:uncharacterized glyoxalase superfamily metalloenzyme YdcJ